MLSNLLQVAAGGAVGSLARYLAGMAGLRLLGAGFPWATLFVNVAGSFAMGILAVVLAGPALRHAPLLMTGLLGGFTTFSAFSLDTLQLWERGEPLLAAAYVLGSVFLSLAALTLGLALARSLA